MRVHLQSILKIGDISEVLEQVNLYMLFYFISSLQINSLN